MVDVGDKPETRRVARAGGSIHMQPETLALVLQGDTKKGDVLASPALRRFRAPSGTAELILCAIHSA